ncbi:MULTISPECIES: hypothetical protein [Streptomyces]|uniref:Uncharacterized protein n=1 Tax=Streptomyces flavovirens TaxID=52258 RepID=A0ABV8NAQ6_9ACTN|nr:hypothetical protein [Streptomyces sp. MBT51]MBK3596270.1 hypothetical protein [Streptomyces sp. MBT51]
MNITKRQAGHYTATTHTGTFTIHRTHRTWHLVGNGTARTFRTMRDAVAALRTLRPTATGGMTVRLTKLIARTHTAARRVSKALSYLARSGQIAADVAAGHLVRTGDILDRLGATDLKDGQKAWYGRHVAKTYRAAHGTDAMKVWTQHRTTGKWIHVFVYGPADAALYTALSTYKATRHLTQADFVEAA